MSKKKDRSRRRLGFFDPPKISDKEPTALPKNDQPSHYRASDDNDISPEEFRILKEVIGTVEEEEEDSIVSSLLFEQQQDQEQQQHIVVHHSCTEDLSWLNQLHNYDNNICSRIHIHIYSNCEDNRQDLNRIIPLIKDCITIHRIHNNYGTENDYAYLHHIVEYYDSLPSMLSFIQGGGIMENPHVIYDMLNNIPGTTYRDLSRHVRDGWHFQEVGLMKGKGEDNIEEVFPYLKERQSWKTGWRSMFSVSREQIRNHELSSYSNILDMLRTKGRCIFPNCHLEVWYSILFGCDPDHLVDDDLQKSLCESGTYPNLSKPVFGDVDLQKNGYRNYPGDKSAAKETNYKKCGTKMALYSTSLSNGELMCITLSEDHSNNNEPQPAVVLSIENLYQELIVGETWKADFSNVTFNKPSQFTSIGIGKLIDTQRL